jgi:hypothetical protein
MPAMVLNMNPAIIYSVLKWYWFVLNPSGHSSQAIADYHEQPQFSRLRVKHLNVAGAQIQGDTSRFSVRARNYYY